MIKVVAGEGIGAVGGTTLSRADARSCAELLVVDVEAGLARTTVVDSRAALAQETITSRTATCTWVGVLNAAARLACVATVTLARIATRAAATAYAHLAGGTVTVDAALRR